MSDIEHWVVDAQAFREAVWAVERESFRPGDALNALERARVDNVGSVRTGQGVLLAEVAAARLVELGWRRRQTYGDGVIRLTRGHMTLFVGPDGTATRPATQACLREFSRLATQGVPFRGGRR